MSAQPNILLIMTDQQRGDCLSCEGHPVLLMVRAKPRPCVPSAKAT